MKGVWGLEQVEIIKDNHPRINKVVHKYAGTSKWEEILEKIIVNHLKSDKLLD